MKTFDYSLNYKKLNLREQPELYGINLGEMLELITLCVLVIALIVAFILLFVDTR